MSGWALTLCRKLPVYISSQADFIKKAGAQKGRKCMCLVIKWRRPYSSTSFKRVTQLFLAAGSLTGAHLERRIGGKLTLSEMPFLFVLVLFVPNLLTPGSHNAMAVSRFPSSQFRCRHFRRQLFQKWWNLLKSRRKTFQKGRIKWEKHIVK